MRRSAIALALLGCCTLAGGCLAQRKPPYANDPLLLHYKPTLSDSATILAEKQARRGPTRPPMPPAPHEPASIDPRLEMTPRTEPIRVQKPSPPESEKITVLPPPPVEPATIAESELLPPPPPPVADPVEAKPPRRPVAITHQALEQAIANAEQKPSVPVVIKSETIVPVRAEFVPTPSADLPREPLRPPIATVEEPKLPPTETLVAAAGKPRRTVDGPYGHDADHRWIQGRLERHHRGYYCVRYRDPSEDDAHGGKVRLQEDARVGAFTDGDIVGVEGGIEHSGGERGFPLFIVRDVWLVRRPLSVVSGQ